MVGNVGDGVDSLLAEYLSHHAWPETGEFLARHPELLGSDVQDRLSEVEAADAVPGAA